jgi:cell division protein FtsI/penicillin-binding protein 2
MKRTADWRNYQRHLRRHQLGAVRRRFTFILPLALVLGVGFLSLWHVASRAAGGSGGPVSAVQAETEGAGLSKLALAGILGARRIDTERPELLSAQLGRVALYAQTTIDPNLQAYCQQMLKRSPSLRGACVVLDPDTGRVLALASKSRGRRPENLCLTASPAASLFKLITAAAAVEEKQLRAESQVRFWGNPHGMPRSTVNPKARGRGTGVTLAEAFACSINPVFGQLGALELGPDALRRYGERFGFNRPIPFELALAESHLEVPEGDFGVAKVAAGFNRTTTITPVHAALLAAAVVCGGRMVEPTVVEHVVDGSLKPLYTPRPAVLEQSFSEATAQELRRMMEATVAEGTCRRSLAPELGQGWQDGVEVGGKTGSISGDEGKVKYDWFAGYAIEKEGGRRLALAVFQEHGKYLGHKSSSIAGRAIRHCFQLDGKVVAQGSHARHQRSWRAAAKSGHRHPAHNKSHHYGSLSHKKRKASGG